MGLRLAGKTAIITGAGNGIGRAFLAADEAGFVNGAELLVDGGLHAILAAPKLAPP